MAKAVLSNQYFYNINFQKSSSLLNFDKKYEFKNQEFVNLINFFTSLLQLSFFESFFILILLNFSVLIAIYF